MLLIVISVVPVIFHAKCLGFKKAVFSFETMMISGLLFLSLMTWRNELLLLGILMIVYSTWCWKLEPKCKVSSKMLSRIVLFSISVVALEFGAVYDLLTSFDYTAKDGIKHFDGGDIIPGDVLVSNAESDMAKLDTRLTMLADELMEENEKRRNVELAYLSLMLSGKKVSECELASEVLKISRAKGEKSLAMLVQSSIKITVKVLSVVLEESSKRYVITFRQLGEDSDETIRSERTDGRRGKDVMQLWGRDLKNHICILFKHNEESKDPSKSGGFRVAPYVIDLGLQKN